MECLHKNNLLFTKGGGILEYASDQNTRVVCIPEYSKDRNIKRNTGKWSRDWMRCFFGGKN